MTLGDFMDAQIARIKRSDYVQTFVEPIPRVHYSGDLCIECESAYALRNRVRCAECGAVHTEQVKRSRERRLHKAIVEPGAYFHGTVNGFRGKGCRCAKCQQAERTYRHRPAEYKMRRLRKEGVQWARLRNFGEQPSLFQAVEGR